ncbi:MAG: 4-hydroxythreonine-4-phosphate dehydrogenase PdxA [Rhodospirillales bacterium]
MKPTIGVLLGDPNGVGPEIAIKMLADPSVREAANILVIGDPNVLKQGEKVTGLKLPVAVIDDPAEADYAGDTLAFLTVPGIDENDIAPGTVSAAAGRSCVLALKVALKLGQAQTIDGFCFAPLNKQALGMGGASHPDEHVFFAHELNHDKPFGEHNVLGNLWTSRVTSHIALKDVAEQITETNIIRATKLACDTLTGAGIANPRIGVCALNPHAGDGGIFGREEIEAMGINASGPFAADTIFVKAKDGAFDAVLTMYHDQGQIAMKLMGFKQGVTVSGGHPVPITTPASGTAFDIVGKNVASAEGLLKAFQLCARMGEVRRRKRAA